MYFWEKERKEINQSMKSMKKRLIKASTQLRLDNHLSIFTQCIDVCVHTAHVYMNLSSQGPKFILPSLVIIVFYLLRRMEGCESKIEYEGTGEKQREKKNNINNVNHR